MNQSQSGCTGKQQWVDWVLCVDMRKCHYLTSLRRSYVGESIENEDRRVVDIFVVIKKETPCCMCPLGAALAIPGRVRMFGWLRRWPECGSPLGADRPRSYGGNRRYQGFQFVDALQRVGAGGPLPPTRLRILDLCQRACRRSARPGERGGSGAQSAVRRQPVAPRAAACLARRTED